MNKLSEKLFERLKNIGLEPDELPKRIMAGYYQRSAGAWRWGCMSKEHTWIGSQDTMKECVEANTLDVYRKEPGWSVGGSDIEVTARS